MARLMIVTSLAILLCVLGASAVVIEQIPHVGEGVAWIKCSSQISDPKLGMTDPCQVAFSRDEATEFEQVEEGASGEGMYSLQVQVDGEDSPYCLQNTGSLTSGKTLQETIIDWMRVYRIAPCEYTENGPVASQLFRNGQNGYIQTSSGLYMTKAFERDKMIRPRSRPDELCFKPDSGCPNCCAWRLVE